MRISLICWGALQAERLAELDEQREVEEKEEEEANNPMLVRQLVFTSKYDVCMLKSCAFQ